LLALDGPRHWVGNELEEFAVARAVLPPKSCLRGEHPHRALFVLRSPPAQHNAGRSLLRTTPLRIHLVELSRAL